MGGNKQDEVIVDIKSAKPLRTSTRNSFRPICRSQLADERGAANQFERCAGKDSIKAYHIDRV